MKVKYRVFSSILCLMMLFMVGCTTNWATGEPLVAQNIKVLRKLSDYNISDLVDGNSEYFYNLFSYYILSNLYGVYADLSNFDTPAEILADTVLENMTSNDKLLLNDSIRYSIESITTDNSNNTTITLDLNAWSWGFENYVSSETGTLADARNYIYALAIMNSGDEYDELTTYSLSENKLTITIPQSAYDNFYYSYSDIFGSPEDYSDFYYGDEVRDNESMILYFSSPYYQEYVDYYQEFVEGATVTAMNDYQDALEYAIYLFVLGYDFNNDNYADYADYFDFTIQYTTDSNSNVSVPKVYVGGWSDDWTPIADALDRVKELYGEYGTYIGISSGNKEQIKRFILEKIIGLEPITDGTTTTYNSSFVIQIEGTNYTYDRDYANVVDNIIEYACNQVLIGGSDGSGEVNIDEPFPISEIIDYTGDTFIVQSTDSSSVNQYGDLSLDYVPEAQYQSLSFQLLPDQVGDNVYVNDIVLVLQYYDDGSSDMTYLDAITIHIGINYYDSSTGILYDYGSTKVTIENTNILTTKDDPDKNLVYFSASKYAKDDDGNAYYDGIVIIEEIPAKMSFDNDIDNGVLNAARNGTEVETGVYAIRIDGSSAARQYYQMNDSSYGSQYATFRSTMFAGKTDYIEVYFDVERDVLDDVLDATSNYCYAFKVGVGYITTISY